MSVSSSFANNGTELIIHVNGRFDFSTLQMFKSAYEDVKANPNNFTVDLKGSEYVDSSALGMLLALREHAGGDSAHIRIINCHPDIRKILTVTKLDELFQIE